MLQFLKDPTASSSAQQQQPAAAASSSSQQQQPAAKGAAHPNLRFVAPTLRFVNRKP